MGNKTGKIIQEAD
jgi:hypothetical protein